MGVPTADSPLPGRDEIVHVRSDNATQFAPSPDGKWVAFEERFRTFVAPFPRTGRPVDIGPGDAGRIPCSASRATPASTCTGRATAAGCTGRSGPELFTRDLARTFTFVRGAGAAASAGRAGGEGRADRLHGRRATGPPASLALVGARVITMAGLKPGPIQGTPGVIENATIVVDGNRITAVGPSVSVQVPAGARRIDVRGKTIMPGIIDVHAHVGGESSGLLAQSSWPLAANLAFGVTTSHDPSNDTETVFTNAELIRSGRQARAAAVLDRHDPLRRGDAVQGGGRDLRRRAVAPAAAEGGRRVLA